MTNGLPIGELGLTFNNSGSEPALLERFIYTSWVILNIALAHFCGVGCLHE